MMRPDEFHLSMRSDLVLILKDVVGLIARIEASIPPAPIAPAPETAGSAARLSGNAAEPSPVVQPAENDHVDRGASAQPHSAFSGPAILSEAEDAGTGQAICETKRGQNPSEGEVGSAVRTGAPIATGQTKGEQVLDLWSTTELSEEQIAARVDCALGSVRGFVYAARKKGDPRGSARKLPHDDKLIRQPAAPGVPFLLSRADDERDPPKQGFAQPVEAKPFVKSTPLDPRPGRIAGVIIDQPGSVISLDMQNLVVACPGGDWQVTRPVALVMKRLRNGDMFDHKTLGEVGSMGGDAFGRCLKAWADELASRGVELVTTKGVGSLIRTAQP